MTVSLKKKVLAKNSKTMAGTRSRVSAAGPDGLTETNSLTGTPMYLSPETVKGERRGKKGAMDVWATGCVILECATGRRPWSNLDNEWYVLPLAFGKRETFTHSSASPPIQGHHVPNWFVGAFCVW